MYVIKRNGSKQDLHADKYTRRIAKLTYGLDGRFCNANLVAQAVTKGVYPGIPTDALDILAAETAADKGDMHSDYSLLAGRIAVSNLHKQTANYRSFSRTMRLLHDKKAPETGEPLVSDEFLKVVLANSIILDAAIVHTRDFENLTFECFKILERSFLMKSDNKPLERPQHMLMRKAVEMNMHDIPAAIQTYERMSTGHSPDALSRLFHPEMPYTPPFPSKSMDRQVSESTESLTGAYTNSSLSDEEDIPVNTSNPEIAAFLDQAYEPKTVMTNIQEEEEEEEGEGEDGAGN